MTSSGLTVAKDGDRQFGGESVIDGQLNPQFGMWSDGIVSNSKHCS